MSEKNSDQYLAELAAEYVAAVRGFSEPYWVGDGERFRFTADGHTVEVSFAGVDTGEEIGWRVIADDVVVKEEEIDEDDCTVGPSAFEEAWLALAELIRPNCGAEAKDKDLLDKAHRDALRKEHRDFVCTDIDGVRHNLRPPEGDYYVASKPEGLFHRINADYWPNEIIREGIEGCRRRLGYDPIDFLVDDVEHNRMLREEAIHVVEGRDELQALWDGEGALFRERRKN